MAPLVVMLVAWIAARLIAAAGRMPAAASTVGALRFALAIMFLFTGASHFLPNTRPDLIRMVPPVLPFPEHLVTLTGILQLAGGVGLLISRFTSLAAYCLAALLVAMFPANAYAAVAGVEFGGRAASPLIWRLPLQLFWIGALVWVARAHRAPRGEFAWSARTD
ncbi:MAG: DoxX family protein [Gemmatimonadota bacterium]|nr:DoxX family protein [Gemmatimonadota bacterium]